MAGCATAVGVAVGADVALGPPVAEAEDVGRVVRLERVVREVLGRGVAAGVEADVDAVAAPDVPPVEVVAVRGVLHDEVQQQRPRRGSQIELRADIELRSLPDWLPVPPGTVGRVRHEGHPWHARRGNGQIEWLHVQPRRGGQDAEPECERNGEHDGADVHGMLLPQRGTPRLYRRACGESKGPMGAGQSSSGPDLARNAPPCGKRLARVPGSSTRAGTPSGTSPSSTIRSPSRRHSTRTVPRTVGMLPLAQS